MCAYEDTAGEIGSVANTELCPTPRWFEFELHGEGHGSCGMLWWEVTLALVLDDVEKLDAGALLDGNGGGGKA